MTYDVKREEVTQEQAEQFVKHIQEKATQNQASLL